jgi:mono/diheme cytochrome c family protein
MPLVSYADLRAPALADPTKNYAQMSVSRMQNTILPMPPAPAVRPTASEIATLQSWIAEGYPDTPCSSPDAAVPVPPIPDASAGGSVYDGPLVCSSGKTYTGGHGSTMRPGDNCQSCHGFKIAGTVYATEHESLFCDGVNVTGATIVITGATGIVTTIPVNNVGNFNSSTTIALPFRAKVVYSGGERDMMTPQMIGACNSCHTADGANAAPGRIELP